jgi:hypothetical protein
VNNPSNLPPGVTNADIEAQVEGAPETANELVDPPPADGEMETQVAILLKTSSKGLAVELQFPNGIVPNERNVAHVVAWYVTNGMSQLLPVAIQSWHAQRLAMLQQSGHAPHHAPQAGGAIAGANGFKLLGADGVPLGS